MSTNYKIEKVPFVQRGNDRLNSTDRTALKYPWPNMKIGDSFWVQGYSVKKSTNLFTTGNNWFKRNLPEGKVSVRREGDGLRVYRIK